MYEIGWESVANKCLYQRTGRPPRTARFYCDSVRVTLPPFSGNEDLPPLSQSARAPRGGDAVMHDTWKDMFVMGLPLPENILRPIIVYPFLVVTPILSATRDLVQLTL